MSIKLLDKKANLVALIVLAHLVFSYYYLPWFFSAFIGSVVIIVLAYFSWGKDFTFRTGLRVRHSEYPLIVLAFAVSLGVSFLALAPVGQTAGIKIHAGNYKDVVHTLFYTLNEEIVLGALLLKGFRHLSKKSPDWTISVTAAFLFAVLHFVFFRWVFRTPGNLSTLTLLSLFAVGVFRNNLIIRTGHIGYSWALHFGWIFVMLGSDHFSTSGGVFLNDLDRFELYLGDHRIVMLCLVPAGLSLLLLRKPTSS